MENTLYYTHSTIAQVMAAFLAFTGVFLIFLFNQNQRAVIRLGAELLESVKSIMPTNYNSIYNYKDFKYAIERGEFKSIVGEANEFLKEAKLKANSNGINHDFLWETLIYNDLKNIQQKTNKDGPRNFRYAFFSGSASIFLSILSLIFIDYLLCSLEIFCLTIKLAYPSMIVSTILFAYAGYRIFVLINKSLIKIN